MNEVIKYDGPVKISIGASRQSVNWRNKEMLWSELVQKLGTVTRTHETLQEFANFPKPKRDAIKDVGGFVGGFLSGNRRKATAIKKRALITLDMDNMTASDCPWDTLMFTNGCAAIAYGTHSYTPEKPRIRIVIPLSREVDLDEYAAVSRRIADDIGIDLCDDTTFEPSRLMYWPSASIDAEYYFKFADGPWLDVDEQLQRYTDWKDPSEWPVSSRKENIILRAAKKQGDPLEKPGVVGAFCRTYSIEDAIDQFLPETYAKLDDNRYTYLGGTTAGGLVLYEDGKFAYSHHNTDPASGKLCNAFDLVRLHMFGDKDAEVLIGTPVNKLPSYTAMQELAMEDKDVKQELALSRVRELADAWDEDEEEVYAWVDKLEVKKNGDIVATIDNIYLILMNDPNLKDCYYYDTFQEAPVISGDMPWIKQEARASARWDDTDDAGLRWYIEKTYHITGIAKVQDALDHAMMEHKRHPVREYLDGLVWDGIDRLDTFFIDYLGAEDSEYIRMVTSKALIGAVARIYRPGCKHDHVLVLVGPQGCGKSTTIAALGKEWFSDSLYTLNGKEAYEQLQGKWLIEMGEMAATKRAELEQIKQFISKQSDSFRPAYGRRTKEYKRQCAFFGTTNDVEFLRDSTGGRRFWPVDVTGERQEEITNDLIDLVWAEAVERYKNGEKWHLDLEGEKYAREAQEKHTELNEKKGLVADFLESPIPDNWYAMTIDERLDYLGTDFGEIVGDQKRDRICAIELWRELFRGDPKNYTPLIAREINSILKSLPGWEKSPSNLNFGCHGKQRGYRKKM